MGSLWFNGKGDILEGDVGRIGDFRFELTSENVAICVGDNFSMKVEWGFFVVNGCVIMVRTECGLSALIAGMEGEKDPEKILMGFLSHGNFGFSIDDLFWWFVMVADLFDNVVSFDASQLIDKIKGVLVK